MSTPGTVIDLPFVQGSDTSEAAAQRNPAKAAADRARILARIQGSEQHGMTCWEVEVALHMKHQTASARINDLHYKFGAVQDSGLRRQTDTRNWAVVWIFVPPAGRPAVLDEAKAKKKLRDYCNGVARKMRKHLTLAQCQEVDALVEKLKGSAQGEGMTETEWAELIALTERVGGGAALRDLRVRRGWYVIDVADGLDIPPITLHRAEDGLPGHGPTIKAAIRWIANNPRQERKDHGTNRIS